MQTTNDRTVDALMEQLIESSPNRLAAAFVPMLNLAMRIDRERDIGALARAHRLRQWPQAQDDLHRNIYISFADGLSFATAETSFGRSSAQGKGKIGAH